MCYCLHLNIPTCMETPKRGNSERNLLHYKTCFKRTQFHQFHHVSWVTKYHRDIIFAAAWGFRFAPCNDSSRWSDGRKGLLRDHHLLLSGPILFMLLKVEQNVYMWKKWEKRDQRWMLNGRLQLCQICSICTSFSRHKWHTNMFLRVWFAKL